MKGNRSSIYKNGELTGNRTTERVHSRSRRSIERNRKTEETIKGREEREREQEYLKVFKETETRAKQIANKYYMEGSNKMENNRKKID